VHKLPEKERTRLEVYTAVKKIYNERLDIVENLKLRTVNNVITEALLNDEQKRLLPLAYLSKLEVENTSGKAEEETMPSLEESIDQFRNFKPSYQYEKQICEWLEVNLPQELLDEDDFYLLG
jgi:hypothetical protein